MRGRCEGKEGGCPLLKRLQEAVDATPGEGETLIPVGGKEMVKFVAELQKGFSAYACHMANVLGGRTPFPVGILCLGGEDESCLRILLQAADLDKLVVALQAMQQLMRVGAAIPPEQVQ